MRKLPLTILAVVALSGATAASASAVPTITANASGALYTGTTGNDVNTLSMVSSPNRYKLTGTATPGTGCSTSGSDIFCPLTGSLGEMHGGAGADELQAQLPAIDATVYGDDGSDHLYASGNAANAYAGTGNDVSTTTANGSGTNYGEAGNDILLLKSTALRAQGGDGDDFVVGGSTSPGAVIQGDAGADRIVVSLPGGSITGGTEDDIVAFSGSAGGFLWSGATVHGNDGADRLYGSPKTDSVYGDAGNDLINTYGDGVADTVDCGADTDVAYVDSIDSTTNCETVNVGSAAPADAQVSGAISDAATYAAAAWNAITPLP